MHHVKIEAEDINDHVAVFKALTEACRSAGPGATVHYFTGPAGHIPRAMTRAVNSIHDKGIANPVALPLGPASDDKRRWEYRLQVAKRRPTASAGRKA